MEYKYNDGGREVSGVKGKGNDCAVRALAIVESMEYKAARTLCKAHGFNATGIERTKFDKVLGSLGYVWQGMPAVKGVPRVKLHELTGNCIASVSKHLVAVVDGVVQDNHDSRRLPEGRCVYGVWVKV